MRHNRGAIFFGFIALVIAGIVFGLFYFMSSGRYVKPRSDSGQALRDAVCLAGVDRADRFQPPDVRA